MAQIYGAQSMTSPLKRVIVKRPEDAFVSQDKIKAEWQRLRFTEEPRLDVAISEHAAMVAAMKAYGTEVLYLPANATSTIDSIYAHDPALITNDGAILFHMGKTIRRGERATYARALPEWQIPICGEIKAPGTAEAGDLLWLDETHLLVGRTYRTNEAGIRQLHELLAPTGVHLLVYDVPHWTGTEDVLHLGTLMSLIDRDLAVAHCKLMPAGLLVMLKEHGVDVIDVDEAEYQRQGSNILALGPKKVLMVEGNSRVEQALKKRGCEIFTFPGEEIAIKGWGGPTCLTRPLVRG